MYFGTQYFPVLSYLTFSSIIISLATVTDTSRSNPTKNILHGNDSSRKQFTIWPRGIVPYFIDDFSFDNVFQDRIRLYLNEVGSQTRLQFVDLPRPPDNDSDRWVLFVNRRGLLECEDYSINNFTSQGIQKVVVGYDCLETGGGALAPTVLALAGVPPQHNAPNRDQYVEILTENILPDKRHMFNVIPKKYWMFQDFEYDFASASHYHSYKYTMNGRITIRPKNSTKNIVVEEAEGLSDIDISKIRKLYKNNVLKENIRLNDCSKLFTLKRVGRSKLVTKNIPRKDESKDDNEENIRHKNIDDVHKEIMSVQKKLNTNITSQTYNELQQYYVKLVDSAKDNGKKFNETKQIETELEKLKFRIKGILLVTHNTKKQRLAEKSDYNTDTD